MFEAQVLEGLLSEALLPYVCASEIVQMRVTSQTWNNAGQYGPYCEVFFFFMKHEPADGEALVGSPFGLCD